MGIEEINKTLEDSKLIEITADFLSATPKHKKTAKKIVLFMCQEGFNYNEMMRVLKLCYHVIRDTTEISEEKLLSYERLNGSGD